MRSRPGRGGPTMRATVAVLLVLVTGACSSGGAIRMVGSAETCGARAGEKVASALARCSARSVAYVETPDASGTGIVIEHAGERYVLTNAHVVDPWGGAWVLLDGEYHDAEVLGVRAQEDIAVLGPIDAPDARPLTVAADATPERGDDVYLVGYPGEAPPDDPDDLEATIARGIVSRTRTVPAFDQTFVQTDASIAGGQSGGPLFDERGRVIGISGLSFADEFALALTATDVAAARDSILAGDGDRGYPAVPIDADSGAELSRTGTLEFNDAADGQQLWVPPATNERTMSFQVDLSAGLTVTMTSSATYDLVAESSNVEQVAAWIDGMFENAAPERGIERTFDPDEFEDPDEGKPSGADDLPGREVSPGSFEVDIDADEGVYIYIEAPIIDAPLTVPYTSSVGVHPLTAARDVADMPVGEVVNRIIGTFDTGDDFLVELAEGEEVEVLAESAQGDVGFVIFPPSVPLDPLSAYDPEAFPGIVAVDDSDIGLYGFDARAILDAKEAGTYRIRLYANDQLTIAARLTLTDCDEIDCEE